MTSAQKMHKCCTESPTKWHIHSITFVLVEMLNNRVSPLAQLQSVNLLLRALKKRIASQNPPRRGGKVPPAVSSLVNAQLVYGFETQGRWENCSFQLWDGSELKAVQKKNTYGSGFIVSSAEFNLLAYSVTDRQYHSIYNYSILYSSYSNSFHWFIYKTVLCTCFSLQCNVTFFQQTRYKKVL